MFIIIRPTHFNFRMLRFVLLLHDFLVILLFVPPNYILDIFRSLGFYYATSADPKNNAKIQTYKGVE